MRHELSGWNTEIYWYFIRITWWDTIIYQSAIIIPSFIFEILFNSFIFGDISLKVGVFYLRQALRHDNYLILSCILWSLIDISWCWSETNHLSNAACSWRSAPKLLFLGLPLEYLGFWQLFYCFLTRMGHNFMIFHSFYTNNHWNMPEIHCNSTVLWHKSRI